MMMMVFFLSNGNYGTERTNARVCTSKAAVSFDIRLMLGGSEQ